MIAGNGAHRGNLTLQVSCLCRPAEFAERFARDEDGAVTVEAVIWIPFFFVVLMLIADVSLAFFSKAQAYRIIENGNRAFAISSTESATESSVSRAFRAQYPRATTANLTVDTQPDKTSGTVSTFIRYRARDVVAFNTLSVLSNWTITVRAQQYVEWPLP